MISRLQAMMLSVAVTLIAGRAARGEGSEAFVRVIAEEAPVHTGPSPSYRTIFTAERGAVYEVLDRGTQGYWFRVRLDDGTTGWLFGELVFPFEVVEDPNPGLLTRIGRGIRRAILGPPPAPDADIGVSFSAGALDSEGIYLLRLSWLLDPYFAVEGSVGLSPRQQDQLFAGGIGWTMRLIPDAAIVPLVHAGVAGAHLRPKADNFTQERQNLLAMVAGAGLEITFRKQITLRLDVRNWTLFDPNQSSNAQEYSGGLAIFF